MGSNVFHPGWYAPWRYPSNWWGNIKLFFRSLKWTWQRAARGFADCDVWNMDSWLLNTLAGALKYFADNHCGWPGDSKFPKDEDWTQYLNSMSQKFYSANECNEYYATPITDKWWNWARKHSGYCSDDNPYVQDMLQEEQENELKRERDFAEAWSMMGDVFWNLWD